MRESFQNLYPFKSHYFSTKSGHKLHYIDKGQSSTPTIFIHGNPTWSFFYRNVISSLKHSHRCIALDNLGCGFSDKPQDKALYTLQNHIDNLVQLVEHLNIESFNLVLHDWGGPIGLGMAQNFPQRLKKLTLLNTAAFHSDKIPKRIHFLKTPILGSILVRTFNLFALPATKMATTKTLPKDVKAGYLAPYNSYRNRIATHQFVKDIPLSESHPSYKTLSKIQAFLPHLKSIPTQVIWGGQDFCFNNHFYNEWKKYLPNAEFHYIKSAGHYLLEDAYDEVDPLLQAFLAES